MLQLLRKIAFPFSLIYLLIITVRNYFYDIGVFKSKTPNTPTICIGNLSVGGTGKTPMIEYVIRLLDTRKLAVLSRGYKRKSVGFQLGNEESTVLDLGDEPYQIQQKFPTISIAVDANRLNGIAQLEQLIKPAVILLDDAFQHRKVNPHLSILLTSYACLYPRDWYLPTGNLRDSKREARRAQLIIVTKCPTNLSEEDKVAITRQIKPKIHQKVLFSSLDYGEKFKDDLGQTVDDILFQDKQIAVVTGIASPEPFIQHLAALNLNFEHLEFSDHHHFTVTELKRINGFDVVITTEKDFVRLKGKVDSLYYLEVGHKFSEKDKSVLKETLESVF